MKAPKLWQVQDCAFAICDVPAVFPHVYVGCISVSPCQWIVKFEKALGCSKFHMQHGDSLLMISTVYIISSDDFWCHCFHANWCRILSINISHIVKINRSLKAYRIMYIYISYNIYVLYCHNHREKYPQPKYATFSHQHWSHHPVPFPTALLIKALWC